MDLDPTYTDKFGDPLLRFTLNWTDHEYKQREFAEQIQTKIAREMGAKFDEGPRPRARYNVINYQSTHIQGGAMMGTLPENSVVNRYLQHWDMPNVFVIGASAFPQNAATESDVDRARADILGDGSDDRPILQASGETDMKRREFLTLPAAAIGGTLLYTLTGEPLRLQAQNGTVKVPLRFFTAEEAKVVTAACSRIFPSDSSGPGATEANVVIYIDRQLAGPYGRDKYRYTKGPWVESYPEHGYQGKASPAETYRAGIKVARRFRRVSHRPIRMRSCASIEKSHFFQLLRTHTIEGMFCDPMHGGNAGLIGWQFVGYPGPSDELSRRNRQALRAALASEACESGKDHRATWKALGRREGITTQEREPI